MLAKGTSQIARMTHVALGWVRRRDVVPRVSLEELLSRVHDSRPNVHPKVFLVFGSLQRGYEYVYMSNAMQCLHVHTDVAPRSLHKRTESAYICIFIVNLFGTFHHGMFACETCRSTKRELTQPFNSKSQCL